MVGFLRDDHWLKNVFKSNYQAKVLLSYITAPFEAGLSYAHSSFRECATAAKIFHELGYCVDVISYLSSREVDYSRYNVIYGMGPVLERSFYGGHDVRVLRIFYATGCNPIYSNVHTTLKVREFRLRHGQLLMESSRVLKDSQMAQILLSDVVVVLGNQFVLNTYTQFDPQGVGRYHRLDAFYHDCYDIDLAHKDFESAKKHFLWFGSGGLLHKGLDVLLDIFSDRDDIYLHICGAPETERGFFDYYQRSISRSRNIMNHGFVKLESQSFREIMDTCGYVLSPSVSEGGAAAILNAIANGGLIPIVTKTTGLDVTDFGWQIDGPTISGFENAINEATRLDNKSVQSLAMRSKSHVREGYSFEKYRGNLEAILRLQLMGR